MKNADQSISKSPIDSNLVFLNKEIEKIFGSLSEPSVTRMKFTVHKLPEASLNQVEYAVDDQCEACGKSDDEYSCTICPIESLMKRLEAE
jgi:hypothetical protein